MSCRLRARTVARYAILALLLNNTPALAQDLEDTEFDVIPVADGLYMLKGAGGNIAVSAGEDGVFLIDDEYPQLTEKLRAAVASISEQPIKFVFNTHWHGDHTGGNEALAEGGALIFAHDNSRKRMTMENSLEAFGYVAKPSPEGALPVVTFDRSITFHRNGLEIHAFHVESAHTDGDAVVFFRGANVVHTGDIFQPHAYPFIDLGTGGSMDGIIHGIDRLLTMIDRDTKVIPGHGRLSNAKDVRRYRNMLVAVRARVAAEIRAGKTPEEVIAAKPTAAFDPEWGQGYINGELLTKILYDDLSDDLSRQSH